ncbi:triosephosphate isomerase [Candidatus Curtissbacteria bacterium]|nr:triosephosphate isomerase [Candidatus Curtissbacteria bacterium]
MNDRLPLVIANLKANKTWDEMSLWLEEITKGTGSFPGTIIVCPTATFIASANQKLASLSSSLKLGAQDISRFEQGAYTGEVAASQIAGLVSYAIIGHSERRQNFAETDDILVQKVLNAQKAGITPIFCVQGPDTPIPQGIEIVAYEPVFAIGTGNPDTPENAKAVSETLKARLAALASIPSRSGRAKLAKGDYVVVYGGSVTPENTKSFLEKGMINGALVGTNSLDPQNFIQILNSAA